MVFRHSTKENIKFQLSFIETTQWLYDLLYFMYDLSYSSFTELNNTFSINEN